MMDKFQICPTNNFCEPNHIARAGVQRNAIRFNAKQNSGKSTGGLYGELRVTLWRA